MRSISDLQIQARALRPITLGLSRTFYVVAGLAVAMDVGSAFFVIPSEPIFGSVMVIGFSFVLFFGLMAMRAGATFLTIDLDGITQCHNFHSEAVRWSQIQKIRIGWFISDLAEVPWNRQVFVSYESDGRPKEMAIFSHTFGTNAEQLIDLLKPYYEHAINKALQPA